MAATTLTRAFCDDPLLRFVLPDDARWRAIAPDFFGTLFDLRLAGGEILVADEGAAVSLWTPPEGNRMGREWTQQRWELLQARFATDERERWGRFEAVSGELRPAEPHWYLGVLGTRPDRQGRGLGREVCGPMLERADREGMPVYLETATPGNLPFYARLGFGVSRGLEVAGGPTVWALWRPAG
jgi:GNAT superfamily N-acetyltransferase